MGATMPSGQTTMTSMSTMMMNFYTSTTTSLYSASWTPSSIGQYAGTCIFLISLAVIFRSLFVLRAIQEHKYADAERKRQSAWKVARDRKSDAATKQNVSSDSSSDVVPGDDMQGIRPWRISTEVPRAALDTIIAGVGYLLMLAVMTMNVGYYLSILGGVFLGGLTIGRYASGPFGFH